MEREEKIRFALTTLKPMALHTFPFICQILGTNDRRVGELFGSGFRCFLGGRKVLVSAAHVFSDGRSQFNELAVSKGNGRMPELLALDVLRIDREADLAVNLAPSDDSVTDGSAYWPEDRIDRSLDRLSTDYLFVHGFPGLRSRPWAMPGDNRVMSRSLPYGVMQRIDNLPDDLHDYQFAMDFEAENIQTEVTVPEPGLFEQSIGPKGLSGSPVWRIGGSGRRAVDWVPDWCELVGVVTQWRPNAKLLVATKITKLLDMANVATESIDGVSSE